ncbi:MAG: 4-hydroxyphenylpyruvate dioxygenase, partial [Myxococcales bacterium]
MAGESLGLLGFDSYTFTVENLERSRVFHRTQFDLREVARSSRELTERTGEAASVFVAGDVRVVVVAPVAQASAAARYLRRHPAGVSTVSLRVESVERARALLVARGATLLGDDVDVRDDRDGLHRSFGVATPLGDVVIRLVERSNLVAPDPGFEPVTQESIPTNQLGLQRVDHLALDVRTLRPALDWFRGVLGLEVMGEDSFHTEQVTPGRTAGAGLHSVVVGDRASGVRFVINEPLAPFFESSQIARFVYDNHGPGVQHVAFLMGRLLPAVEEMRRRGTDFLPTPAAYYEALPARLEHLKITNLREQLASLERLEILVDGRDDAYL